MHTPSISVSANVLPFRDGKVLMGLRKNAVGEGEWGFIGGHVEFGEGIEDCAKRELAEETGLQVQELEYLGVINQPGQPGSGKHYIHFIFKVDNPQGEPQNLEPDLCGELKWFALNEIPDNLFFAHKKYLETLKSDRKIIIEEQL